MTQNSRTIFSGVRARGTLGQGHCWEVADLKSNQPSTYAGPDLISELNYLSIPGLSKSSVQWGEPSFTQVKHLRSWQAFLITGFPAQHQPGRSPLLTSQLKRVPQTYHQPQRTASLPLLNRVNLNCSLSLQNILSGTAIKHSEIILEFCWPQLRMAYANNN